MSRWSTISVEVDKDEVLRELDDDDLKEELERRNRPVPTKPDRIIDAKTIEQDMKIKIIRENLHKFSWLEICEIFENKKY